jgi:hypothetical protein
MQFFLFFSIHTEQPRIFSCCQRGKRENKNGRKGEKEERKEGKKRRKERKERKGSGIGKEGGKREEEGQDSRDEESFWRIKF